MHFIRDLVHDMIIDLQLCPSSEQNANIFTKTFTKKKFQTLRDRLAVKTQCPRNCPFLLLIHCPLRGGGGGFPTLFFLFPHFFPVFISCIVHEYLKWSSSRDSFFTP
jgi:hypothetical protein